VSEVALIASIALGFAFLLAGGSKLAAGHAWPAQARGLGAPAFAIPILPWLELAVGAALVVGIATPVPAILAVLLLVAFTALIVVRLAEGEHPPCACFGAWSATPIGPRHLVRNGALILLGLAALVG
jgi:uncharacterized membrane protein YphA (DoxX/SURF4 family)